METPTIAERQLAPRRRQDSSTQMTLTISTTDATAISVTALNGYHWEVLGAPTLEASIACGSIANRTSAIQVPSPTG